MTLTLIPFVVVSLVNRLAALASLPAALAHELSHALVALPWAEEVSVSFDGEGAAQCHVVWRDDGPPEYASLMAAYAPLWIGGLLGAAMFGALLTGPLPETLVEWLIVSTAGAYWTVFIAHDPRDRGRRGDDR